MRMNKNMFYFILLELVDENDEKALNEHGYLNGLELDDVPKFQIG